MNPPANAGVAAVKIAVKSRSIHDSIRSCGLARNSKNFVAAPMVNSVCPRESLHCAKEARSPTRPLPRHCPGQVSLDDMQHPLPRARAERDAHGSTESSANPSAIPLTSTAQHRFYRAPCGRCLSSIPCGMTFAIFSPLFRIWHPRIQCHSSAQADYSQVPEGVRCSCVEIGAVNHSGRSSRRFSLWFQHGLSRRSSRSREETPHQGQPRPDLRRGWRSSRSYFCANRALAQPSPSARAAKKPQRSLRVLLGAEVVPALLCARSPSTPF